MDANKTKIVLAFGSYGAKMSCINITSTRQPGSPESCKPQSSVVDPLPVRALTGSCHSCGWPGHRRLRLRLGVAGLAACIDPPSCSFSKSSSAYLLDSIVTADPALVPHFEHSRRYTL